MTDNNNKGPIYVFKNSSQQKSLEGLLEAKENTVLFHPLKGNDLEQHYKVFQSNIRTIGAAPKFIFTRDNEQMFITNINVDNTDINDFNKLFEFAQKSGFKSGGGRRLKTTRRGAGPVGPVKLKLMMAQPVPVRPSPCRVTTARKITPRRRTAPS